MNKFRKLDLFKKVPKDLSQGTNLGGLFSILTVLLMVYFMVSQFRLFIYPPQVSNINLDQPFTRKQLTINLDIEFPRFPCQLLALDLQDDMMTHTPNVQTIKKYRIDKLGDFVDDGDFQLLREQDGVKQYQIALLAFQKEYGCRIRGQLQVKEVPGNFHISSHPYHGIYNRLRAQNKIQALDISHKIHYLYFGAPINMNRVAWKHRQAQLTPLNSHHRIYSPQSLLSLTSHYHIDIVPTVYSSLFENILSYQYTWMHNTFPVRHMSVLYFKYHIGGTRVTVASDRGQLVSFLLNVCAVVGGIYALASFLYNTLFVLLGVKIGYQELGR